MAIDGNFDPAKYGFKVTQLIEPKYIVKQSIGAGASLAAIKAACELGPDIFSLVCQAAKDEGITEEDLKETGIDTLLAAGRGFIEGGLSCSIYNLCQAGTFGQSLKNAEPDVVASLVFLAVDAARYGYSLSKGEITAEDYGNLMAEHLMAAAGGIAVGRLALVLFEGSKIAYIAGAMAGAMLAVAGYNLGKEVVLEMRDGGGFEAMVPEGVLDTVNVAQEAISSLGIKEKLSAFKDVILSTASDGKIRIKAAIG